jgi:hypothetical protein
MLRWLTKGETTESLLDVVDTDHRYPSDEMSHEGLRMRHTGFNLFYFVIWNHNVSHGRGLRTRQFS